ncbi:MAG: bifunctional pantoate--beta-alanine ligase/(d)CMP kinase [Cyanobacteria bacterium]|nr:bifunctional pantoate--beta-alanine ligase/(d)CMP kinase [Cyanobacteria bacterium bin.51]
MLLLRTCAELLRWCASLRLQQRPLHFVPTMGALHEGHLSLIRRAAQVQPAAGAEPVHPGVLVSVFVNPLQFGPLEDLATYPEDLEQDCCLAAAAGAEAIFAPTVRELFPEGLAGLTRVQPPTYLSDVLCGQTRAGHFEGVATVVTRLLGLIRPDCLLLGEKDWQQLVILRRVVSDLGLPLEVRGCRTWREPDGLAGSSRNRYLSPAERSRAAALPATLQSARGRLAAGESLVAPLLEWLRRELELAGLDVEYAELVEPFSLRPLPTLPRSPSLALLAVAVRCGSTRLIDHMVLMPRPPIVAIDGPAGAGKSTVTRAFARTLGLTFLDTGAMYRAVTWWLRGQGVDLADAMAIEPLLAGLTLSLSTDADGDLQVSVNGHDVTTTIRDPAVTAQVSVVAAHACVRSALTRQQQAMGERGGLVAEGRDIGTAVFPDADLKVFLTASVAERARRRALDLSERGYPTPELAELEAQISERDHLDSTRSVAPLLKAADAVELVTDGMAIEAVIAELVRLFRQRIPEDAWPESAPV